jgi:hypothetical protein
MISVILTGNISGGTINITNLVTKTTIGLGNVDNTSDANKPISTAQQTALNNKVDKISGKSLSENDLTSGLKTNYDTAYSHSQATGNPHSTSKTDLGLNNVPNVDATNPANIIQDSTHRFVSDAQLSSLTQINKIKTLALFGIIS